MKYLAILLLTLTSATAMAVEYSESSFSNRMHSAYVGLGFDRGGGLGIGGDYEYAYDRTFGLGALLRIHSKDEEENYPGRMIIGGFIRPHFHRRAWDLYVTMGAAMVNYDAPSPNADDASGIGPTYGLGLLYQVTDAISLGLDQTTYVVWFGGDEIQGSPYSELMARLRIQF